MAFDINFQERAIIDLEVIKRSNRYVLFTLTFNAGAIVWFQTRPRVELWSMRRDRNVKFCLASAVGKAYIKYLNIGQVTIFQIATCFIIYFKGVNFLKDARHAQRVKANVGSRINCHVLASC